MSPSLVRMTTCGLLGESAAMKWLYSMLTRLEGSLVNVLIQGESGVGKELVARALHQGSARADGPPVQPIISAARTATMITDRAITPDNWTILSERLM